MATGAVSANRLEILQIANAVAAEKSIDKRIVLEAMEEAIKKAALALRPGRDIRARDQPGQRANTRRVARADCCRDGREPGDAADARPKPRKWTPTPRSATSSAKSCRRSNSAASPPRRRKQVITGKVREAERARQYNDFKDRVGEIINGTVKRVEYGHVIVDLGKAEGVIRRNDGIPRENFNTGDRVRSVPLQGVLGSQGPADLPVALAPELHDRALRPGGARGLRRRDRDQGLRP